VLVFVDYRLKGKSDTEQSKYYLFKKLLILLQALIVFLSIAIFTYGIVSGWDQMVPSKQIRELISTKEEELKNNKAELKEIEPAIKQMEAVWSTRQDSLINAYKSEQPHKSEMMISRNNDLANKINAGGDTALQTLNEIKNYHLQNEYLSQPSQFEPIFTEIKDYIEKQSLPPEIKSLIKEYSDNWYAQVLSRFEINTLSEDQLKLATYPAYHKRQQRLNYLKDAIPSAENELTQYRTESKYNIEAFGLQILLAAIIFIVFTWLIGIIFESLQMTLDMVVHLKNISEHYTKQ
jgi:hypothetical protein